MVSATHIKTEHFEGPVELLLQLIEKRELAINDISLSAVTDEYLQTINNLPPSAWGQVTHFMVVAATLVLIKSRTLLPTIELTEEESEDVHHLEERLRLYQIVRDTLPGLAELWMNEPIYERTFVPIKMGPSFDPDPDVSLDGLSLVMKSILATMPAPEATPTATIRPSITLAEMINRITARLDQGEGSLRQLILEHAGNDAPADKNNTIVGFLALLELSRHQTLTMIQSEHFGDITFIRSS